MREFTFHLEEVPVSTNIKRPLPGVAYSSRMRGFTRVVFSIDEPIVVRVPESGDDLKDLEEALLKLGEAVARAQERWSREEEDESDSF